MICSEDSLALYRKRARKPELSLSMDSKTLRHEVKDCPTANFKYKFEPYVALSLRDGSGVVDIPKHTYEPQMVEGFDGQERFKAASWLYRPESKMSFQACDRKYKDKKYKYPKEMNKVTGFVVEEESTGDWTRKGDRYYKAFSSKTQGQDRAWNKLSVVVISDKELSKQTLDYVYLKITPEDKLPKRTMQAVYGGETLNSDGEYEQDEGVYEPDETYRSMDDADNFKLVAGAWLPYAQTSGAEGRNLRAGELQAIVCAREQDYKEYVLKYGSERVKLSHVLETGQVIYVKKQDYLEQLAELYYSKLTKKWKFSGEVAAELKFKNRQITKKVIKLLGDRIKIRHAGFSNQQVRRA